MLPDDDNIEDPLPAIRATIDQFKMALPIQMDLLSSVYKEGVEAGFSEEQSMEIVMRYLETILESTDEDD